MLGNYISNGYGQIQALKRLRMARLLFVANSSPMELDGMLGGVSTNIKNVASHSIGRLFGLLLLILIGASLLGPVANATTGITIAHTGFTPNPNVTATPGFVPLIQVLPLVFIGVLLGYGVDELASVL